MAHVSLYRKYRPATFAEVVGQDHVTTTLARAVDAGSWHHAYLFTGPRGTGKTSSARIFAMALNATAGPTSSPPQDDPIVQSIRAGNAPDVIEIDAASNNKVEDVRDLVDRVAFSPAIARQKVYIVDECHMLTTQAWNAFLKTIEEPPGHVVFVFATTEPHKVLPTVLSRTQRFDFRRVPAKVLADHCRHIGDLEGFTFADDALAAIVKAGDGSVRDTLSVLDQVVAFTGPDVTAEGVASVLGSVPATLLDALADALIAGDVAATLRLVDRVADGGTDLRQFATDAVDHLRSLLLLASAPGAGLVEATPERLEEMTAQAARTGPVDLLRAVELLNDAQPKMRRGNTRLPLEIALAKAALPGSGGDPAALAARLDRVEAALAEGAPPRAASGAGGTPAPSPAAAAPAPSPPADAAAPVTADDRPVATPTSPAGASSASAAPPSVSSPSVSSAPPASASAAPASPAAQAPTPPSTDRDDPAEEADGGGHGSAGARAADGAGARGQDSDGAGDEARDDAGDGDGAGDGAGVGAGDGGRADGSTPSRADVAPGAGGGGAADALTAVTRAWPTVVDTLGGVSRRMAAIYGEGTPVSAANGTLTLRFAFDFHASQAEDPAATETVAGVLERAVGTRYRIATVVAQEDDPPPPAVAVDDEVSAVINREAEDAAGQVTDDDSVHDAAIATLTTVLGAEVVADRTE